MTHINIKEVMIVFATFKPSSSMYGNTNVCSKNWLSNIAETNLNMVEFERFILYGGYSIVKKSLSL